MTREEAIKKIKKVIEESVIFEDELEAFDIAIKALEHPEKNVVAVVPCGDAISRQAVLDKAAYTETEEGWIGMTVTVREIKALPSVTPQQRTGRWIDSHIPESTLCECSECGFTCGAYSFNYCPDCGAKMEVEG